MCRNILLFLLGKQMRIECLDYMIGGIFKFKRHCQITYQSEFCHWALPLAC